MASDTITDAITDYLTANWTACPLGYENDVDVSPEPPAPWVYVEIVGKLWDQDSIGAGEPITENRYIETGTIFFHVFVPTGWGTKTQRQYARQLADLFRGAELLDGTLRFTEASLGVGQPGDDKGVWWVKTATVEFVREY